MHDNGPIFAKLKTVKTQLCGQELTWKRSGLKASIKGESIMAEMESGAKTEADNLKLIEMSVEAFQLLLQLIVNHLQMVDGEAVQATAEDLEEELNHAIITKMWVDWHMACTKVDEVEKNALPQP